MPRVNSNPKCLVARQSWELRNKAFPDAITLIDARRKESELEKQAKAFLAHKRKNQGRVNRRGNLVACRMF